MKNIEHDLHMSKTENKKQESIKLNNQHIKYFNISWLSKNDGPGKRLVLFLQGCPLDCAWCHSPHSQPEQSPLLFFDSLCTHCQRCAENCPNDVHTFSKDTHTIESDKCMSCGKCIESCPQSSENKHGSALILPTQRKEIDVLFEGLRPQLELLKNDGGITFSGGEPLLQSKTLTALARKCKEAGFNTALETSGIVPLKSVERIAPYIDTWLLGMRLTTGTNNFSADFLETQTRKTFQYLSKLNNSKLILRIPAIEGYTTTQEYLKRVHEITATSQTFDLEVLPFNKSSSHYYNAIGISPSLNFKDLESNSAFEFISNNLKYLIKKKL